MNATEKAIQELNISLAVFTTEQKNTNEKLDDLKKLMLSKSDVAKIAKDIVIEQKMVCSKIDRRWSIGLISSAFVALATSIITWLKNG